MRRCIAVVFAGLLLSGLLAGQDSRNQRLRMSSGTVTVYVSLPHHEHPKAGITVDLQDAGGISVLKTVTNDKGEANLFDVPTGRSYLMVISGEGIVTKKKWIQLDSLETDHSEYIEVTPGDPGQAPVVIDADVPPKARKELEKGNDSAQKNQWQEASDHYQKAIELYPNYATAYNNLGSARMNLNDAAGAKAAFEHAVAINDKYAGAWLNLARIQHQSGDLKGAEQSLKKALAAEPKNVQVLADLAQVELLLNNFDATEDYERQANALPHQGYAMIHVLAAYAYQQQNKVPEALAEYKLYLQEDPKGPMAQKVQTNIQALEKSKTP